MNEGSTIRNYPAHSERVCNGCKYLHTQAMMRGHKSVTDNYSCAHDDFKGERGLLSNAPVRTIHFNHSGSCTTPSWCPLLPQNKKAPQFQTIAHQWMDWSTETFEKANELSSLEKLSVELDELAQAIVHSQERKKVLHEYVDVLMCLLHSAAKYGFTFEEIKDGFIEKSAINYAREWVLDETGNTYSHKKQRIITGL